MAFSIPSFTKLTTGIPAVDQTIERIFTTFVGILSKQIIDGQLLKDVSIPTGSVVKVPHTLSRKVTGYIVIKKNANAQIWDSEASNTLPTKFLNLNSSANVVISLWVF